MSGELGRALTELEEPANGSPDPLAGSGPRPSGFAKAIGRGCADDTTVSASDDVPLTILLECCKLAARRSPVPMAYLSPSATYLFYGLSL